MEYWLRELRDDTAKVDDITEQMQDHIKILQAPRLIARSKASISDAWHKAARLIIMASNILAEQDAKSEIQDEEIAEDVQLYDLDLAAAQSVRCHSIARLRDLRNAYPAIMRNLMITEDGAKAQLQSCVGGVIP